MRLAHLTHNFLKPIFTSIYRAIVSSRIFRKITYYPKSRNKLHQYWKQPWDGANLPQNYLKGEARSQLLVEIIKKYVKHSLSILELGCNVGRNLNYLFNSGFMNLSGIEISEEAVQLLKKTYPEMANHSKIYNLSVEEIIKEFSDEEFNVVFTMAVLEHIHIDSEWLFFEMVRITKDFLITIEDERGVSWGRFPRKYKKIFESLGMKQIDKINCDKIDGLGSYFIARVFKKISSS